MLTDSIDQLVAVRLDSTRPEGLGGIELVLSQADLALIESPEGLICADATRSTGWTVRVPS